MTTRMSLSLLSAVVERVERGRGAQLTRVTLRVSRERDTLREAPIVIEMGRNKRKDCILFDLYVSDTQIKNHLLLYPQLKKMLDTYKMLKKVAICMSGQPRFFKKCVKNILFTLVHYYDADVFCHLWASDNKAGTPNLDKEQVRQEAIDAYQPKAIEVEDFCLETHCVNAEMRQKYKDPNDYWYGFRTPTTISHYYSLYRCNELKKQYEQQQQFTYDVVIHIRPDLQLYQPIVTLNELQSIDLHGVWMHTKSSSCNVNPAVYFGSSEMMDIVCSAWTKFDEYYKRGMIIFDEQVLYDHITINQVPLRKKYMPYCLLRADRPHDSDEIRRYTSFEEKTLRPNDEQAFYK